MKFKNTNNDRMNIKYSLIGILSEFWGHKRKLFSHCFLKSG